MAIKTIEVICIPCQKCERLLKQIENTIKSMELQKKIKIDYQIKHTCQIKEINKYSLNPSQVPALIINGNLELAGHIEPLVLRAKLESIHSGY